MLAWSSASAQQSRHRQRGALCRFCTRHVARAPMGRQSRGEGGRGNRTSRERKEAGQLSARAEWCASTPGPTSKTRAMASDEYSRAASYQAPLRCWHPWGAPSGLLIHSGASCPPSACVREGGWPGCRCRASSCQAACRRPSAATATLPARHSARAGGSGGVGAAQPQRPGTPWVPCWALASASAARHLLMRACQAKTASSRSGRLVVSARAVCKGTRGGEVEAGRGIKARAAQGKAAAGDVGIGCTPKRR